MIKNEREYRITKTQVAKFAKALDSMVGEPEDDELSPRIRRAETDAFRYQIADLGRQLEEFETLSSGQCQLLQLESFAELPDALIKARIAARLTQKQLAEKLGLKEQQIQRYEALGYTGASIGKIIDVVEALNIKILLKIDIGTENRKPALATSTSGDIA